MDNFDWKTYTENYEDLQKIGINTKELAWAHWINYGRKENRTFKKLNNVISALNVNCNNTNDNLKKNLLIIACHTNNNLKYTILKNNIKYFEKDNIDIILVNSVEYEKTYDYFISDKIIDKIYVQNNVLIDFGKWIYIIENRNYVKNYKNIIFTNDSYIIVNNIDNYLKKIDDNNYDLYGYNDSSEIKYHYQSYLFAIKTSKIQNLINLFYDNLHKINSTFAVVFFLEINLINYFNNRDCFLKISSDTKGKNVFFICDNLYESLLNKGLLPFIKLKRLSSEHNKVNTLPKFLINYLVKNYIIN